MYPCYTIVLMFTSSPRLCRLALCHRSHRFFWCENVGWRRRLRSKRESNATELASCDTKLWPQVVFLVELSKRMGHFSTNHLPIWLIFTHLIGISQLSMHLKLRITKTFPTPLAKGDWCLELIVLHFPNKKDTLSDFCSNGDGQVKVSLDFGNGLHVWHQVALVLVFINLRRPSSAAKWTKKNWTKKYNLIILIIGIFWQWYKSSIRTCNNHHFCQTKRNLQHLATRSRTFPSSVAPRHAA